MQPVIVKEREKRHLGEIVSNFIHNWRYALWAVLILAAAFLVGYFVWSEWNKKLASDSTAAMEKVQSKFDSWKTEADTAKKTSAEKDLLTELDALVARYPRHYGGQRGLFMRSEVYVSGKLWDKAARDYLDLAARFPKSYLAPISLFNAGVCLEEVGDREGALAQYVKITREYTDSAVAPRAVFDAGRLYEAKDSIEEAQKSYESLEANYPSSEWTKLAKNRIIALKVEGKIK